MKFSSALCIVTIGLAVLSTVQGGRLKRGTDLELRNSLQNEKRHSNRDCGVKDAPECIRWKAMGLCDSDTYNVHCATTCGFCKEELISEVEIETRGRLRRGADLALEHSLQKRHEEMDCSRRDAPECFRWLDMGLCNDVRHNIHCGRTCGFCGLEMQKEVLIELRHMKKDCGMKDAPECERWRAMGLCESDIYNVHCANTCGFCKEEIETREECEDEGDAEDCAWWSEQGYCAVDSEFNAEMLRLCAKTCGCGGK